MSSTPSPSSKSEDSSITPPEAWGGEKPSDKYTHLRSLPSRFGMFASSSQTAGSVLSGLPDLSSTSQTSISSSTTSNFSYANLRNKDVSLNQESSIDLPEHLSSSSGPTSLGTKGILANLDPSASLALPRRFSTYAERISTTSSFSDGTSLSTGSPKIKKTGAEREELFSSLLSKSDTSAAVEPGILPAINVRM